VVPARKQPGDGKDSFSLARQRAISCNWRGFCDALARNNKSVADAILKNFDCIR
jgi:hypothetical protein